LLLTTLSHGNEVGLFYNDPEPTRGKPHCLRQQLCLSYGKVRSLNNVAQR